MKNEQITIKTKPADQIKEMWQKGLLEPDWGTWDFLAKYCNRTIKIDNINAAGVATLHLNYYESLQFDPKMYAVVKEGLTIE